MSHYCENKVNTIIKILKRMLTYGSKACVICKQDESRITAPEMKFVMTMAGYIPFNYKNNLHMMKELCTQPIMEFNGNLQI
jgi:hypothetical protein